MRFDDSCAGTQQIVKYLHLPLEATNAEFTMWCGCDDANRTMGIGNTVMSVPACSGTIQAQGDEKPREFKLEAFTGHVQSYMNKVREAVHIRDIDNRCQVLKRTKFKSLFLEVANSS